MNIKTLVMILGGLLLLLLLNWVTKQEAASVSNEIPVSRFASGEEPLGAISDSTSDTLRTLIAEINQKDAALKKLSGEVSALQREVSSKSQPTPTQGGADVKRLESEIAALRAELDGVQDRVVENEIRAVETTTTPVSLPESYDTNNVPSSGGVQSNYKDLIPKLLLPGMNQGGSGEVQSGVALPSSEGEGLLGLKPKEESMVWVNPIDAITVVDDKGNSKSTFPSEKLKAIEDAKREEGTSGDAGTQKESVKVYTIPPNTVITEATNISAIVGRVPQAGAVVDPFLFSLTLGAENLAANGHSLPFLDSIIVSGEAVGDYTMECSRGSISSLTYVFRDGTVYTEESSDDDAYGFIADEYGVPCVPGHYISNAAQYMTQQGLLSTVVGVANSVATAQQTITSNTDGTTQSVITGDSVKYAASQGLADSVGEMSDWLKDRQDSAFDAVFIPVGKKLSVVLTRMIEIDYQVAGRQIRHSVEQEYGK